MATVVRMAILVIVAFCLVDNRATPVCSAEPANATNSSKFTEIIGRLDDDDFDVRERAVADLVDLSGNAAASDALAKAVRAALDRSDISFEARCRLDVLARHLPQIKLGFRGKITDEELDLLVVQLDGDTYASRVGAAARLASLVERADIACRVVERLRPLRRLPTLSRQTRERVESIWDHAQLVWLSSDPRTWQWPAVEQEQIDHWLDMLVRTLPPSPADASMEETRARLERQRRLAGRETAQAELLGLLVRDDLTARVKSAIDERLAGGRLDDDARQRLTELAAWARQWLSLESWTEHKVVNLVELPVGTPFQVTGAAKATLFDQVDERQARCVSDTGLPPGNYPVGVLFPHPSPLRSDWQYLIINLESPRARLAYHYRLKGDRDRRMTELSERTLARLIAEKRPLTHAEFIMLSSLDAHAVSRFAAKYLVTMGDPTPRDRQREESAGRGSPHASLCNLLVEIGTHEAVPGILAAIQAGKLPKPSAQSPADWPWAAVLAILATDPGPDADQILGGLLGRTNPLVLGSNILSDVGATAAAVLLDRHKVPLERFGLELVDDPLLAEFGGIGYRYNPPEMREKVLRWWQQQQAAPAAEGAKKQR
ncbi:MAG TPA: hypothetical protein VHC22_26255 [Pirellulales bacterium]|nr:hypothetical protein [Pirellulales bacterium]